MTLDDLLVSYKQVSPPKIEDEEININDGRYRRMLLYVSQRLTEPTIPTTSSFKFQWDLSKIKPVSISASIPTLTSSKQFSLWRGLRLQWINDMTTAYRKAGLSDNTIKLLLAKNAFESGWGTSRMSEHFNYGNITAGSNWDGEVVNSGDKDAKGNPITQNFRKYNSIDHWVNDELQFLKTLYDFTGNETINEFVDKLLGGNKGKRSYAEDPSYKRSVINVYNSLI